MNQIGNRVQKELSLVLNDNLIMLTNRHINNDADNEAIVLPYLEWSYHKNTLLKQVLRLRHSIPR
jgi:hypothetical protein